MKKIVKYILFFITTLLSVFVNAQCGLKDALAEALFNDSKLIEHFNSFPDDIKAYEVLYNVNKTKSTVVSELQFVSSKLKNNSVEGLLSKIANTGSYFRWRELVNSGVSKFGQSLDEIGEVLENGLVKGKYSRRTFDPNKVGGKILKLDYSNANITSQGISDIKLHLQRLDPDDWNIDMIKRLEDIEAGKISATSFDNKFYTHELRELERARATGLSDTHKLTNDEWNNLHSATLEDYQLFEKMDYNGENIYSLYHPSVQN